MQSRKTPKLIGQIKSELSVLVDALGPDTLTSAVDCSSAGQIYEVLLFLPSVFRRHPELCELTFQEMKERADALHLQPMSPRTANGYLSTMRGLFEHEKRTGRVTTNPFSGMSVPVPHTGKSKRGFTTAEIGQFFGLPLFHGCAGDSRPYDHGSYLVDNWRFWAPLIAFFTGARVSETAQFRTSDVREADGVWVLDINAQDGKRVKTACAIRIVPIHSEMVRLGLVRLARDRRDQGQTNLLPEVPKPVGGDPGKQLSRWLSEKVLPR